MIERATIVLRFQAEYQDHEVSDVESDIRTFIREWFGDEVALESFTPELSENNGLD